MLWDRDANILDCNREAVNLLGLSGKKELKERFFQLAPELQPGGLASREMFQQELAKVFDEKEGYGRFDWTHHQASGEAIPFDITLVRIAYKDGYAAFAYARDMRGLKSSTRMLREKTSTLAAIIDATSDLIFCKDADLRHTECNKALENHLQVKKSDIVGKNDAEAFDFPPELVEHYAAKDRQVIAEKKVSIVEEIIPSPDGRAQLFETIKSPIIDDDGQVIGLVGISRDITQRKAAEENLGRQNSLMATVNAAAAVLLEPDADGGAGALDRGMETVCRAVDADRVHLWKNIPKDDGKLYCRQVCKWARPEYFRERELAEFAYEDTLPAWEKLFSAGQSLNGPLDTLPANRPEFFPEPWPESLLAVPLFLRGDLWGFVSFDDCRGRRVFPAADEHILRSWGLLVVGALQRGEIMRDLERAVAEAQKAHGEAEAANRAKSSFLAAMSHEIRTPMNAISGMAELLLRRNLPDEAKAEARDIKQASANLIAIINDILDFSKIEAGKMEIIPARYMLLSLVNDTVNIIRMRLAEKRIRFYTNIDGKIPYNLIGDEVRLRQILLNLLSNAAKYTEKGHISLSIAAQKRESGRVWLEITVADSGKGIKPEYQEKLFGSFAQLDLEGNRGIEGTGLGLAITRELCLAMNGTITVESEYGRGSAFKAVIPQGVDSEEPFAEVSEPEKKRVLVYEGRSVWARTLCWSLENLGVPHVMTETAEAFAEALPREEWYYVFSGHGLYGRIKPLMEKTVFPGGRKPPLALMVEWENEAVIPGVRFISLPIQSLSIANVLNGKDEALGYSRAPSARLIRYTYPGARLLVVDDIGSNLKVAEGLLAPYQAQLDTCLSGARALELVKKLEYDLIFMDHMMPDMDGVEATAAIRAWEREKKLAGGRRAPIAIVALTANAVSGMREMFIENGFDDFLAKPIDISKLDEILGRWMPKEKRGLAAPEKEKARAPGVEGKGAEGGAEKAGPAPRAPQIPGLDMGRGLALVGWNMEIYHQALSAFCRDAQKRLPGLQKGPPAAADLPGFVTGVHALGGAAASLGAAEISARAAALEAAGRAGELDFIRGNLSSFAEHVAELAAGIEAWEKAQKEWDSPGGAPAGGASAGRRA
jgi:PAS domain S-box-containing protein